MARISIVTITLNSASFVADAISSVLSQSFTDFELIVQDGLSDDNTASIVEKFGDDRIQFVSEADQGLYDALNRGFLRAKTDIIGMLHSDDCFFNDNVLAAVVDAFDDPNIDAVYGDLVYVNRADPLRVVRVWRGGKCSALNVKFGWMPPHPTLFVRRRVLEEYGLFDATLKISADYDAFLRYFMSKTIVFRYLPCFMVKMRAGGVSNKSWSSFIVRAIEDYGSIKRNNVGSWNVLFFKWLRKLPQFFRGMNV